MAASHACTAQTRAGVPVATRPRPAHPPGHPVLAAMHAGPAVPDGTAMEHLPDGASIEMHELRPWSLP